MNVVYICDDKFAWIAGVSMLSLLRNNKNVRIMLLAWNFSNDSKEKLSSIAKRENGVLDVIDIPEKYIRAEFESVRWPSITYVRLYLAELLPENIERVIYLDSDTVVLDDLSSLFEQDMHGNICCGVKDCLNWRYKRNIGLNRDSLYINAGVMLVDVDMLRKIPMSSLENEWMNVHHNSLSYQEQDLINGVFQGKIGVLDARFNVMTIIANWSYKELYLLRRPTDYYSDIELDKAKMHPAIVHYTTNLWTIRPWFRDSDHPWCKEFDKYLALSPWRDKEKETLCRKGFSAKAMIVLRLLPTSVCLFIIGFIHTYIHPNLVKTRNIFLKKNI